MSRKKVVIGAAVLTGLAAIIASKIKHQKMAKTHPIPEPPKPTPGPTS
jgi:hypothetical protein